MTSDSDRSGEAGETGNTDSTVGKSAGPSGHRPNPGPTPSAPTLREAAQKLLVRLDELHPTLNERPTIAQLEAILAANPGTVEMKPDGSVHVMPRDEIEALRAALERSSEPDALIEKQEPDLTKLWVYLQAIADEHADVLRPKQVEILYEAAAYLHDLASTPSVEKQIARPLEEWHEDYGDVVWWKFPVSEAGFIGSPLDSAWPGYHTHWTPHPEIPDPPAIESGAHRTQSQPLSDGSGL